MAHKGVIWGMYVQPSARRGRIGRQLVEAILDLARQRVELIQLTVVRDCPSSEILRQEAA